MIGLVAGLVGGMAGIGGSLVMLPALGLLLGYDEPQRSVQHVYMAAAMIVNVLVALPATLQHARAGNVKRELVRHVLPSMAVAIILGVLLSETFDGRRLVHVLAAFIIAYSLVNVVGALSGRAEREWSGARGGPGALCGVGALGGFFAGLLGIGGGVVMVPLLQVLCRVPLRAAVGTSSAVMCISATIGGSLKLWGVPSHGHSITETLLLAAAMAPTAILGGLAGAKLANHLPVRSLRLVVSLLLAVAAARLALSERPGSHVESGAKVEEHSHE